MSRTARQFFQRNMTDTELRTEDSLQPVKYLGKILCFHPYGLAETTVRRRRFAIDSTRLLSLSAGFGSAHLATVEKRTHLQSLRPFDPFVRFERLRRNRSGNVQKRLVSRDREHFLLRGGTVPSSFIRLDRSCKSDGRSGMSFSSVQIE